MSARLRGLPRACLGTFWEKSKASSEEQWVILTERHPEGKGERVAGPGEWGAVLHVAHLCLPRALFLLGIAPDPSGEDSKWDHWGRLFTFLLKRLRSTFAGQWAECGRKQGLCAPLAGRVRCAAPRRVGGRGPRERRSLRLRGESSSAGWHWEHWRLPRLWQDTGLGRGWLERSEWPWGVNRFEHGRRCHWPQEQEKN